MLFTSVLEKIGTVKYFNSKDILNHVTTPSV